MEKYQWKSSNIDFILFNEHGSITPVFSDIEKLPKGIIKAFNAFSSIKKD